MVGGLLSLVLWPSPLPLPCPGTGRPSAVPSPTLPPLFLSLLHISPVRPVPSPPVPPGWLWVGFLFFSRPHPVLCLFLGWGCFSGGPSPPHFTRILVKGGGWSWVTFPSEVPFPSPPDRVCGMPPLCPVPSSPGSPSHPLPALPAPAKTTQNIGKQHIGID